MLLSEFFPGFLPGNEDVADDRQHVIMCFSKAFVDLAAIAQ
jgi:hypothetical protein